VGELVERRDHLVPGLRVGPVLYELHERVGADLVDAEHAGQLVAPRLEGEGRFGGVGRHRRPPVGIRWMRTTSHSTACPTASRAGAREGRGWSRERMSRAPGVNAAT